MLSNKGKDNPQEPKYLPILLILNIQKRKLIFNQLCYFSIVP